MWNLTNFLHGEDAGNPLRGRRRKGKKERREGEEKEGKGGDEGEEEGKD
jgi:hypothetical protein